jgi:RHS repeat-associated protein
MIAAEQEADVFSLAALCLLSENSHQGHRLPTAVLHRGFALVISNTATSFGALGYDFRVGPRSTGKERDAETGLDYFGARYMSSPMGRWMSPDWAVNQEPVPYAKLTDPQTLNFYSYVQNNPLSRWDTDGHETQTYYGNPSYAAQQASDRRISSTEWKIWGGVALGVGALSGASEIAAGTRGLWDLGARTAAAAYLGLSVLGTQAAQNLMSSRDAVSSTLSAIKDAAASGEISLPGGTANLLRSAGNAVSNSFTNSDINGALKQAVTGIEAGGDHVQELQDVANSLTNLSGRLGNALANPTLSDQTRTLYQNAVKAIQPAVDQINKLTK